MIQGRLTIQIPLTIFESIREYREAFASGGIDFFSVIGSKCPLCGREGCYRAITPYERWVIDLFPRFRKERIPVARFLCRTVRKTFSLLPIHLIPYGLYTVDAVAGTLLMGLGCFRLGGRGFQGASVAVDPEGSVTPWLVYSWLIKVFFGFQRCHRVLRRWFDLSILSTSPSRWETVGGYFKALGWEGDYHRRLGDVLFRYGRATRSFLFGTPSQERRSRFLAGSSA